MERPCGLCGNALKKKEETPQQNKVLKVFSKNGNASKKRKRLNKIKFKDFFQKTETPQKKEETPQQNKVLKVFPKNRNASKKTETPQQNNFFPKNGNASKKRGNASTK